jgi:hypothetical protein
MADEFAYENIITSNYKIIKIHTKINTPELFISIVAQTAFIEKLMKFHVRYNLSFIKWREK